ncbi:hypothetical protein SAMN05428949_4664 [Chitinophaga sp. YR627]|uniref:hypothetical protein n=1 Tax=Chitinophaga sp. YR627 TaxID=1881041 RepID=UPI0008E18256|nr:hypothetical protein [Chitinophaga sp. YR627]SFO25209.1 hypothetical protein SAMN05428949_4664 [Chitinophaga sp. YR627]
MKTSYKLLIAFAGFLVLLMLIANSVMWANFKRGYSGKGPITMEVNKPRTGLDLKPFKVLVLEGPRDSHLPVIKADKNVVVFREDQNGKFMYSYHNDTLFLNLNKHNVSVLECTDVTDVILKEGSVFLQQFNQPVLNVLAKEGCGIHIIDVQLGKLAVSGGDGCELKVEGDYSKVDSLQVTLGKNSAVESYNVPYKDVQMDIETLAVFRMEGISAASIKKIR